SHVDKLVDQPFSVAVPFLVRDLNFYRCGWCLIRKSFIIGGSEQTWVEDGEYSG
ncbi:hypothetical protein PTT_07530, partial [Pyrenophora teres f. teres 0-1]